MDIKITVHCLVKNEDRWIWFALHSVLPFVAKVLVYDTGSTDETLNIVKGIGDKKIILYEKGECSKKKLVKLRQEMIEKTETNWFLILDGDEIWPEESLKKSITLANKAPKNTVAIFNPVRNCIGDIFHYLSEKEGRYQIGGMTGNFNIRLIRKTNTMRVIGEYPLEVYQDENGPVQQQKKNLLYVDSWYLHTSFLKRSFKDLGKVSGSFGRSKIWRYGIGMKTDELPKVFFLDYPKVVGNPLQKRGFIYDAVSLILNPLITASRKMA